MIIQGDLFVISACTDLGFYDCLFGVYASNGELNLRTKFWNRSIPVGMMVSFIGQVNRTAKDDKAVFIDVKDYVVKGEPADGLAFLVSLQIHGQIQNGCIINSNIWHGKELGVFGDFKTKYMFKAADTVRKH